MSSFFHYSDTSLVTLNESTISATSMSSSSETSTIEATSSAEDIASGKGIPSSFEIEDVSVTRSTEATATSTDVPSNTTSEEIRSPDHDPPPDGGLFAWLQVLGGWILVLNSRGMTNTFGAFQSYYTNILLPGTKPSAISWIGSTQTFTLMFVGVLSGRLLDAGYLRYQLCAGIFLEVLGMVLTSFSTKYWQILLSQGICVGLGSGLLYLPSVAVPAQYFSSKVMLATGLVTTGSSVAGVIYPILIRKLTPALPQGYAWTTRCIALIVLVTNCTALALMRSRLKRGIARPFKINVSMFLDAPYVLFVLAMTFLFTSVYIPYFYLEDYAGSVNSNQGAIQYILSIMNAASFFGRVLPNWLADWKGMNSLIMVSITCLISGVIVSSWLAIHTGGGTIAFATIYGFISGGLVSLPPATVVTLSRNQEEFGTRLGMAFTICSFGALVGNPIAGVLLVTGRVTSPRQPFRGPWLFAAGTMITAAALTMGAYYLHNKYSERNDNDGRHASPESRRRAQWLRSLANEALTMQGAGFAL